MVENEGSGDGTRIKITYAKLERRKTMDERKVELARMYSDEDQITFFTVTRSQVFVSTIPWESVSVFNREQFTELLQKIVEDES